jgi:hypothetical protein
VRPDDALTTELVGMVRSVREVWPDLPDARATALERALRRTVASVVVDPEMTAAQLLTSCGRPSSANVGLVPGSSPRGRPAIRAEARDRCHDRSGELSTAGPDPRICPQVLVDLAQVVGGWG